MGVHRTLVQGRAQSAQNQLHKENIVSTLVSLSSSLSLSLSLSNTHTYSSWIEDKCNFFLFVCFQLGPDRYLTWGFTRMNSFISHISGNSIVLIYKQGSKCYGNWSKFPQFEGYTAVIWYHVNYTPNHCCTQYIKWNEQSE